MIYTIVWADNIRPKNGRTVGANCVRPLWIILNGATHKRSVKDGSFVTARSARLREQKELSSGQNFKTHFAFIKFWAPPCETPYEILLQRIVGNGVLDVPMRADIIRPYGNFIIYDNIRRVGACSHRILYEIMKTGEHSSPLRSLYFYVFVFSRTSNARPYKLTI
jgi:hypothetical protein